MTSLLGKKKFEELLGALTYKPRGKPALVRFRIKLLSYKLSMVLRRLW